MVLRFSLKEFMENLKLCYGNPLFIVISESMFEYKKGLVSVVKVTIPPNENKSSSSQWLRLNFILFTFSIDEMPSR